MAVIASFVELSTAERPRLHPTSVVCGWRVDTLPETGVVLTLETYGSDERAIPGKVSQSLQVTAESAAELVALVKRVFDV